MSRKHGFFRPHLGRGFPQVASTTLREGGGGIITSIFADGTDGFYFDFSKTDRTFQDTANTLADDAAESIWLALESHSWGGKSLDGLIAAQSEARGTGAIALLGTATAATYNTSTGDGTVTRVDASNQSYVTFSPAVGTHRLEIAVTGVAITVRNQTATGAVLISSIAAGTTGVVYVSATSQIISINAQAAGTASFNVVSLKAIPGNHGLQATAAARPSRQTGGLARFDGTDDNLLTTLVPGTANTLMAKVKFGAAISTARVIIGGPTTNRFFLGRSASEKVAGGVGSDSTAVITGGSTISGSTGVAALVQDGSTVALYWNNTLLYSGAQNGTIGSDALRVGAANGGGTASVFSDDDLYRALAIKKALTQAQIAAITNLWGTS